MMQGYATDFWRGMDDLHGFSFYRKPIQNIEPCRAITVVDVYRYLVGHYAKPQTFRKRNEKELIQHSGLLCLDFDHVGNPDRFKERLLKHDYFDTELMFTSPSGDGVKWIIPIDLKGWEHSRYFKAVANCIESTGLPPVDKSGSDVARSCFLPYDPQAYINPKYSEYVKENLFRPILGECPF